MKTKSAGGVVFFFSLTNPARNLKFATELIRGDSVILCYALGHVSLP